MRHKRAALVLIVALPLWICLVASPKVDPAALPGPAWLIVPGVSVGPITANTGIADLIKAFGEGNVQERDVDVGEGEYHSGAVIYPGDLTRRAEIVWKDAIQKRRPEAILITDYGSPKSRWRTPQGISLGTTLRELEGLNRRPFVLAGFDWDYGGTVSSWRGGTLEKALRGKLTLRLAPTIRDPSKIVGQAYASVVGDQEIHSNYWIMQKLNPRVYQMVISL